MTTPQLRGVFIYCCALLISGPLVSARGDWSNDDLVLALIEEPTGPLVRGMDRDLISESCEQAISNFAAPKDGSKISALRLVQAQAARSDEIDKRLRLLDQAIEADPQNVRAALLRAWTLFAQRGESEAAKKLWQERPTDARAVALWGAATPAGREEQLKLFARAVKLAGTDPEAAAIAASFQASALARVGRTTEALDACDRALATHQAAAWFINGAKLHVYRGLCRLELGDPEQALQNFNVAQHLYPYEVEAMQGIWLTKQRTGLFRVALVMAQSYRVAHPDDAYGKVMYAASLTRLGRYNEALEELATATSDEHVETERAAATHLKGDPDAAMKHLDQALKTSPAFRPALTARAALRASGGAESLDAARADLKLAVTDAPQAPILIATMLVCAAAKDYPAAATAAAAALASRRVAPCYRDPLLKAAEAFKAGKPYAAPPELLRAVYEPPVLFR